MVLGKLVNHETCKSVKLVLSHTPYIKIYPKWFKDLNIKHDIIKLPGENTGKAFSDINCDNFFLDQSPKAKELKAKTNKYDPIKLKIFCIVMETIKK